MSNIPIKQKKQGIVSAKDFNLLLRIFTANWWIFLITIPVFYGIGSLYVYRLTTVYKASTEIMLKTNESYYQNNVLSEASFYNYTSYVDNVNETRVLQSFDLAAKVVDKLLNRLQVSYFIVGKVRTTEQFGGMPFQIEVKSLNPEFYEKVLDFHILDEASYQISYDWENKTKTLRGKFNKELLDLNFHINVHRENNLNATTIQTLKEVFYQFSVHQRAQLITGIQSNLKIENPEYTNILHLELKDILPERAVIILDTLNMVYAQSRLVNRFELNQRTIEYIDRQLNEISFSLKSIEDTMQQYKEKKSIIDLNWQQQDFLSKIGNYDGQRSQLQLQLKAFDDLETYI
ncbi:MAG TPA: Wzz/FepE/Etk N-terminal domain-containing protein, partial [Bacteroidia bacterium]|nr:Wzz/FepE/Etk N-terminal domain-containing protein [Bacteroidia bacterium]